ncbi:MAG: NAD-dependent epimerase/dehydratase family protein [Thermoproteota archaeon]|jgi:UDP-glucose 4-epimerase|nr:NAD-dependent epimerase/dehydratase family protein [Thermoproteota archaeon]
MHKVLVTGGAGFIGHHLIKRLSAMDCKITIIDNLSNSNRIFLHMIKRAIQASSVGTSRYVSLNDDGIDDVAFYAEDIRNKDALIDIFESEEIDTCVHLASKISVPESITNPGDTIDVNIKGTFNVLEACSKTEVKNLVFASSSAVYGESKTLPISEKEQLDPLSPYGASKIAGEALVSSFRNTRKIQNAVSIRIFNVFGEGGYAGVITKFAERLLAGLPPVIYGNGNQTRDFIFVDDVVSAIVLSAAVADKKQEEKSASYPSSYAHILNVGAGRALKIKDLAQMMIQIFNLDLEPVYSEARSGDIINSLADMSRLETVLGFVPSREIVPSLKQMFPL